MSLPHSRLDKATMRAVVVMFILALITIAGEIYSDAAITSGEASHTAAPDPATAAIAHRLKHGQVARESRPERLGNTANQVGFLILGRTPSVDGRPRASRR